MTRILLVVAFVLAGQAGITACDSCGSSILGQEGGLLSQYRKSYASLGWSQSGFHTAPGIGEGSDDLFNTMDFAFQYFLSKRWQARFYQPYSYNVRTIKTDQQSIAGFGDSRLSANYTFLIQQDNQKPIELFLSAGAGIILPTGQYDPNIHDQNMPENFNPGRGSMGYTIQQTNSISYRSLGVILNNSWTSFAKTKEGYQFGHQWVGNFQIIWEQPIDSSLTVLPLAGIQMESIGVDTYANGNTVYGTGGDGLFFNVGMQLKYNFWLCTFQYAIPVSNAYSQGEVDAGNRINLQLTHLF